MRAWSAGIAARPSLPWPSDKATPGINKKPTARALVTQFREDRFMFFAYRLREWSKAANTLRRLCQRGLNRRLEADGHDPLSIAFDPQPANMDGLPGVGLVHASHDHGVAEIKHFRRNERRLRDHDLHAPALHRE